MRACFFVGEWGGKFIMIIVLKQGTPQKEIEKIKRSIQMKGLQIDESRGAKKNSYGTCRGYISY